MRRAANSTDSSANRSAEPASYPQISQTRHIYEIATHEPPSLPLSLRDLALIVFQQAAQPFPTPHPFPVLNGLLESAKGIAVRCLCLGDFFPHDSGLRSGTVRGAMSLHPTRSASPGIPP